MGGSKPTRKILIGGVKFFHVWDNGNKIEIKRSVYIDKRNPTCTDKLSAICIGTK